jgi:predicted secreted protein
MNRSRKIIVFCHCILNSNTKVAPLATYNGVLKEAVNDFIEKGYGIIQLPCPEVTYLGMNRWGMSKDQYDHPSYRRHCKKILEPYADQIEAFANADYQIHGVVGVNGSPSCGVSQTPIGLEGGVPGPDETPFENIKNVNQSGIFIEELKAVLESRGIAVNFMAIDEKNPSNIKDV